MKFVVGEFVETVMGCRRKGQVVKPFAHFFANDGSFGPPHYHDVYVLWDDGSKGYWKPAMLMRQRISENRGVK